MTKLLWKIGGEAGFGIVTTGQVFAKIINRQGYYTFDYIQYPSLIRGGHNTIDVMVSDEEVTALKKPVDFLVCLNKDTFEFHKERLTPTSVVIFDPTEFTPDGEFVKIAVPFAEILKTNEGQTVMKNTIALGASLAALGLDLEILNTLLEEQFGKKGEPVVNFNKKFAEEGFSHVKKNYSQSIKQLLPKKETGQKLVMSGNEAFSLASVLADCRLYVAYPMTPSSTILTVLASWQEKNGMVVRHAEDEISVINTAIGAAFAGVRASVGTSGGGFALMVESISLAGVTETPIVIFLAERPGPATGMPTWTEQGDLLFAIHAGHGEFPKIVLAPGDMEEMLELGAKAYNLADVYQTPVIVVSDMLLSESHKSVPREFLDRLKADYKVERGKTVSTPTDTKYLRYKVTDDGISERLIPGAKGFFYQANSYEHLEDSHTTEEAGPRTAQVEKRNKKNQTYLKTHFQPPKLYGAKDSKTVFVGWGSVKGAILDAQKILKLKGQETAFVHFTHVYPMNEEIIKPFFPEGKRYILVENNSQAQFGKLLRAETGIDIKEKLLRYDGRPFWSEDIANYLK